MGYLWEIPAYDTYKLRDKLNKYCICIPVINEGEKILGQLEKLKPYSSEADIIICDGGSTDGSTDVDILKDKGVYALLVKTGPGKLSAQLRMGYSYALNQGYEGIITIDGNGKDSVESVIEFIKSLNEGWDFIQGSRFIKGGKAINTPLTRHIAVKLIHVPVVSYVAGFKYTDTTNGYRGYSRTFLLDDRVQPFRNVFDTYELLAYLSVRAPRLGYKTKEIPVERKYPSKGKIPTKISFIKGNVKLLSILWKLVTHSYDPK